MNRRTTALPPLLALSLLALSVLAGGCVGVRRELTVESDPAGALVYLNGDEVGRTPLTREFIYYGTMDLKLRKDGYELLEDTPRVWAPWWQVPPIDLIAEGLSLTDRHKVSYELTPQQQGAAPKELVSRGMALRGELASSEVKSKSKASTTAPSDVQP